MRDSRFNQKSAVQENFRPHYRDHHMPSDRDRDLPVKDMIIVVLGVIAAMLLMAVVTGWMLDATYKEAEERTSQVIEQIDEPANRLEIRKTDVS